MPATPMLNCTDIGPASVSMVQSNGSSRPRVICINQTANFSWPEPKPTKKHKNARPD